MAAAISKYRQNALTSCICLGVRHSASKIAGDPTNTQIAFAREVATFSRFELNRNSMPCGAYVTGRRNGIDHERRFLTLEFIDRADPGRITMHWNFRMAGSRSWPIESHEHDVLLRLGDA
jgi:hypothetical protein